MNATKTSYQFINGEYIELDANGSVPALKWVDTNGNGWSVLGKYQFDSDREIYTIVVNKRVMPVGTTQWIDSSEYNITADYNQFRILATGQLIPSTDGVPSALDDKGNIVNPNGWVYNSKYFTIGIGYNPAHQPVSINYFVYLEMAAYENVIIN